MVGLPTSVPFSGDVPLLLRETPTPTCSYLTGADSINSNSKRRIRQCREYFDKVFEQESTATLLRWMQLVEEAKVTEFHVTGKA